MISQVKGAAGIHFSSFDSGKETVDPDIRDEVELTETNQMMGNVKMNPDFLMEVKKARGLL